MSELRRRGDRASTPRLRPVDLQTWSRRELFEHYRNRAPCTYSVTVELDVTELRTALRSADRKTLPAQIWAISTLVNRVREFRMTIDDEGHPAVWDLLQPRFTVFNPERETFAAVWTPYTPDFSRFHDDVTEMLEKYRHAKTMFPQADQPGNVFDISSLPWMSFTGFDLHIPGGDQHYLPIFTIGRHCERRGRTLMPLAIQIHHAVADGFHVARLVNGLQAKLDEPSWLR